MTDRDEPDTTTCKMPPTTTTTTTNSRSTPSRCCSRGSADEAANNDQTESLGEIWFDTMRRNHGGTNSNSTPSSPTNSTAEPEGSESSATSNPPYKKRKFGHPPQQQQQTQQQQPQPPESSYNTSSSSGSLHKTDVSAVTAKDANPHNHSNEKRGGYQSDDEGFHLANSSDSSGYFRRGDHSQPPSDAKNDDDDKTKTPVSSNTGDMPTTTTTNQDSNNTTALDRSASPSQKTQSTAAKKVTQKRHLQETTGSDNKNKNKNKKRPEDADKDQDDDKNNSKKRKIKALDVGGSTGGDTDTLQQRLERNAREKERSSKITDQFQSLKDMLALVGVVVPKGTKGSILSLAYQYIVKMKRQEAQQAADNRLLQLEVETIGKGSRGPTAVQALRVAAQRNGVAVHPGQVPVPLPPPKPAAAAACFDPLTVVQPQDYPVLWDHSPSGVALATLGGTFLDCNQVFQRLLHFSKAQLREISIFHLIDSHDDKGNLQFAFDQITNMLQSIDPNNNNNNNNNNNAMTSGTRPVVLRGSVQGHGHLGLAISLLHASNSMQQPQENGTQLHQHYLCVTLIDKSPTTTTTTDDASPAVLRPAHPCMVPTSSLATQPTRATSILPMVGYENDRSIVEPAAISAAAATLTALPTSMLRNHPCPQAASSSLSSSSTCASSGLLPMMAGTNMMLTTGATMASAINMMQQDGGMSLQESASKEQQQQNFGGSDPFYTGTVG